MVVPFVPAASMLQRRYPCAWYRLPVALLLSCFVLGVAPTPSARADSRTDYMLHCQGCHGPTGVGAAGAAPSFRSELAKFLWVPGGREYLVRVPGTSQAELDDARVAALLNWLLYEFSPREVPADFVPYDREEVARYRRAPLVDVDRARRDLLRAIEDRSRAPVGPSS